jgi:acetyltransferase-like isoleucine patch superfamily enzyme
MFYTREELMKMGFRSLGENVLISDKSSIYNASKISIGSNVRIDDFCILSAGKSIAIGNNVHIACYSSLIGQEEIVMEDFSGLSSRVSIYSSSDDYSGEFLTNPTVDSQFTGVISKPVYIGKHVIVGAGSVILPGVSLQNGVAVGALSLVTKSFDEYKIVGGSPAKFIKDRKRKIEELEWLYLKK